MVIHNYSAQLHILTTATLIISKYPKSRGRGQGHVTKFVILHPLIIPSASNFTQSLGRRSTTKSIHKMATQWALLGSRDQLRNLHFLNYPAAARYRERGIVFAGFLCLFVYLFLCLFVSLSARLRENGWTDLHEIFREGVE